MNEETIATRVIRAIGPTENRLDEPEGCCDECGGETDGAALCYDCGRDRYAQERYDEYER